MRAIGWKTTCAFLWLHLVVGPDEETARDSRIGSVVEVPWSSRYTIGSQSGALINVTARIIKLVIYYKIMDYFQIFNYPLIIQFIRGILLFTYYCPNIILAFHRIIHVVYNVSQE